MREWSTLLDDDDEEKSTHSDFRLTLLPHSQPYLDLTGPEGQRLRTGSFLVLKLSIHEGGKGLEMGSHAG